MATNPATVRTTRQTWEITRDQGKFLREITVRTAKVALRQEQARGRFPRDRALYTTWTDRNPRKPEERVRFGGSIAYIQRIQLGEVYEFIMRELVRLSPYGEAKRRGKERFRQRHYDESHVVLVDGRAVLREGGDASILAIRNATKRVGPNSKVQFVNIQPYARRIEQGNTEYKRQPDKRYRRARDGATTLGFKKPYNWTMQAPNGVYKLVASRAARQFRGIARIRFTYAQLPALGYSFTHQGQKISQFYPVIIVRSDFSGAVTP